MLRSGGFHNTDAEWVTSTFFDREVPADIAMAIRRPVTTTWNDGAIRSRLGVYEEDAFLDQFRRVAAVYMVPHD